MRKPSYIVPAICALAVLGAAASVVAACEPRVVDVGTNDASATTPASTPLDAGLQRTQYGCAEFVDEEVRDLRAGACGGQCTSTPDLPYDLASKQAVIAATAGKWMFCEGALGPAGSIGIDFSPGCRLFFLTKDQNGVAVRGTEAAYQATYDIYDPRPSGSSGRIDIHFDDGSTTTYELTAHRCPEHLQMVGPGQTRIELAPDFGDAGRTDPVAIVTTARCRLL